MREKVDFLGAFGTFPSSIFFFAQGKEMGQDQAVYTILNVAFSF